MQIDLRTVRIDPQRNTFDHIARRFGDKPASRYQEGTYDLQPDVNFHYRPTWDPAHQIFDASRTRLTMKDWYAFKDPRQFYYGTYTMARARMQETAEADFDFVEERGLADMYPAEARALALSVFLPLRHVAWGANMNNSAMCAYGYGTAITQPCMYHAMDQLGIAQYLTRLGFLLGDNNSLVVSKKAWLEGEAWQKLRHYVEDTLVLQDWFEQFIAQNFVLDGLLYPLVYQSFDQHLTKTAGPTVSLLTRFQSEWFAETSKWVDSAVKVAVDESAGNKQIVAEWTNQWRLRALEALAPIVHMALADSAASALSDVGAQFAVRERKAGLGA
jgi:phenol hydroxylase P1 protein